MGIPCGWDDILITVVARTGVLANRTTYDSGPPNHFPVSRRTLGHGYEEPPHMSSQERGAGTYLTPQQAIVYRVKSYIHNNLVELFQEGVTHAG